MRCPRCNLHSVLIDWDDALHKRILRCYLCSRKVVIGEEDAVSGRVYDELDASFDPNTGNAWLSGGDLTSKAK